MLLRTTETMSSEFDCVSLLKSTFEASLEHPREMQGASATPTTDQDYPMLFTKRATSIIPSGGIIQLHAQATKSVDYEGELGIIIGKAGTLIKH